MIEFIAQQEAVHHITATIGSGRSHFWYFLSVPEAKPFDASRDQQLVEMFYNEGTKLQIGAHALLISKDGHHYNVGRMDAKNYSVQSLSVV
jgi:hypothetical protein